MRYLLPLLLTACAPDVSGTGGVAWEIRSDSIAWVSNAGELDVRDYPSGWRAHWKCAPYGGEYHEVWVSLPVTDGAWSRLEPRHVQVSRCWSETPCEECCPCVD